MHIVVLEKLFAHWLRIIALRPCWWTSHFLFLGYCTHAGLNALQLHHNLSENILTLFWITFFSCIWTVYFVCACGCSSCCFIYLYCPIFYLITTSTLCPLVLILRETDWLFFHSYCFTWVIDFVCIFYIYLDYFLPDFTILLVNFGNIILFGPCVCYKEFFLQDVCLSSSRVGLQFYHGARDALLLYEAIVPVKVSLEGDCSK